MTNLSKGKRKNISTDIQTNVLSKSGRRCCLCFGIHSDFDEKRGQIAHLDHDRTNNTESNLVFMCLSHHDLYDGKAKQSKNYTIGEVREYRKNLYSLISKIKRDTERKLLSKIPKGGIKKGIPKTFNIKPSEAKLEFIPYYNDQSIKYGQKSYICFKIKNNTDKDIQFLSYQFEAFYNGKMFHQFPKHSFDLILEANSEKIIPYNYVDPIKAYFRSSTNKGMYESKVYLEYRIGKGLRNFVSSGVAMIFIS